jgi:hypothetical protein
MHTCRLIDLLWLTAPLFFLGCVTLAGCGPRQPRAAAVDAELARESLLTVLDSWKKGDAPKSLRQHSPSITVQDMDWEMGYTLVDYRIDEGKSADANLLCPVTLSLRDPQGKEVKRQVRYMVGTDPTITVFREMHL